jgi:hypothetical protein
VCSREWRRDIRRADAEVASDPEDDEPRPVLRNSEIGEVDQLRGDFVTRPHPVVEELAGCSKCVTHEQPGCALIRGEEAWHILEDEGGRLSLIKEASDLSEEVAAVRLRTVVVP